LALGEKKTHRKQREGTKRRTNFGALDLHRARRQKKGKQQTKGREEKTFHLLQYKLEDEEKKRVGRGGGRCQLKLKKLIVKKEGAQKK